MLSSLTRVASSHLLDSDLWRRLGIGPEGLPDKSAPPAWSRLQVAQDDGPA
jgi:hypothetical protein